MNRTFYKHTNLITRCAAGLLIACTFPNLVSAATPGRPNIIFVLTDDLGYGDVGVLFQNARAAAKDPARPWHLTPEIDKFAADGIQLRDHYCPAAVCAPSRASLILGVHQGHSNLRDNQFDKAIEDNHTLGTVMHKAGYITAAIGKWGLQGTNGHVIANPPEYPGSWTAYPTRRGFDYYFGYVRHKDGHEHYPKEGLLDGHKQVWDMDKDIGDEMDKCYTADLWTARAKKWIEDQEATNSSQPFFLYLAYDTPHTPQELPTEAYPPGGGVKGGVQWLGTPGHMINTADGKVDSYYYPEFANATFVADSGAPAVPWRDVHKRYASAIRRVDDALGDLVQLLKDLKIDDNTLVIFSSDNGPEIDMPVNFFDSYGPFDGVKRDTWEGGIRVPTFVRWPRHIRAGTISTSPSQFHDWMATFAELAGVTPPARCDGVSLLPTLLGENGRQKPSTVYVEYYENHNTPDYSIFTPAHRNRLRNQMQAIRFGDLLGVRYDIKKQSDDFEIYKVDNDPRQSVNLAAKPEYAALQQQMKDTVLQLRRPNSSAPRPYDTNLVPAVTVSSLVPGIQWRAYTQAFPWVPELTTLHESSRGTSAVPSLDVRPRDNDLGMLFTGYINVPRDGDYEFSLTADTGALLRIHEATVIDADFGYHGGTEKSGAIRLQAGQHPFRLYYARGSKDQPSLALQWSGPGITKQAVPAAAFSCSK